MNAGDKIALLNRILPEIINKIYVLDIEQTLKTKIMEFIAKEILGIVETTNNQIIKY